MQLNMGERASRWPADKTAGFTVGLVKRDVSAIGGTRMAPRKVRRIRTLTRLLSSGRSLHARVPLRRCQRQDIVTRHLPALPSRTVSSAGLISSKRNRCVICSLSRNLPFW